MARNQYDPLAFETYAEPVQPMSVWDYLTATGKLAKGAAAGAVSAP